jgi:hypothetical protein
MDFVQISSTSVGILTPGHAAKFRWNLRLFRASASKIELSPHDRGEFVNRIASGNLAEHLYPLKPGSNLLQCSQI